jgi:hypothetical protein
VSRPRVGPQRYAFRSVRPAGGIIVLTVFGGHARMSRKRAAARRR